MHDGCEVRLCGLCAFVRVFRVSRDVCPGSPRCLFTGNELADLKAISPRLSTFVASVCPLAPPKCQTRSPRVSFQLIVGPCQVTLQTWLSQLRRLALE